MVFTGRPNPFAQPRSERFEHLGTRGRVVLEQRPLVVGELLDLVQHRRRHGDLADIVQEHTPCQTVPVGVRQAHLLGDQIGVGAHAFRMPSGQSIVPTQPGHEHDGVLGRLGRRSPQPTALELLRTTAHLFDGPGTQRDAEARGRTVGEHQGGSEQGRQRQEPAGQRPHRLRHQRAEGGCLHDPRHETDPADRAVQMVGGHPDREIGDENRHEERHDAERRREPR